MSTEIVLEELVTRFPVPPAVVADIRALAAAALQAANSAEAALAQILSEAETSRAIYERILAVSNGIAIPPGPNSTVPTPPAGYDLILKADGAYVRDEDGYYLALPQAGAGTGGPTSWASITGKPQTFPPAPHGHPISEITGLQGALDAKAATSAIPTTEALQDLVAAMFQAGTHSNASVSYDDNAGTLNITATTGGGAGTLSQEEVEDFVGRLVVQGTGINVTYDDAGNVLRIALAGESYTTADKNKLAGIAAGATANATDANLRDRSTHTGTQSIASVSGLQTALDSLSGRISAVETNGPGAPEVQSAPTADPEIVIRGDQVTFSLGTWSAGTPVGTLMQGGVNRTGEIVGGKWTAADVGEWTWTVINGAAPPYVIEGTTTSPQPITVKVSNPFVLPTVMEDQTYSQPLSALFGSPYTLTHALQNAPNGVGITGNSIVVSDEVAIGSHSFTVTATDRYDQSQSLTINLTVQALPVGQVLAVNSDPDATLSVTIEEGTATITVLEPPEYAGSYAVTATDYQDGPINHVPPSLAGQAGPDQVYTATPGFWSHDTAAGTLTVHRRWQVDGEDTEGQTETTFATTPGDAGKAIRWAETATDANGTLSVYSAEMEFAVSALPDDVFNPGGSAKPLTAFVGASGETWTKANPAFTANLSVRHGYNLVEGGSGDACYRGAAQRGPAQFARGMFRRGSGTSTGQRGRVLAILINGSACYCAGFNPGNNTFFIGRVSSSNVATTLATAPNTLAGFAAPGDMTEFRIERRPGGNLTARFGGTIEITFVDTTLSDGGVGLMSLDTSTALSGTSPNTFNGGAL